MSENTEPGASTEQGQEPNEGQHTDWFESLPEDAQKEITKLRKENASHREKKNSANEELEQLRKEKKTYEAEKKKQAEENGKYKELYETEAERIKTFDELSDEVKNYRDFFNAQVQEEYDSATENQKAIIDELPDMPAQKKLAVIRKLKGDGSAAPSSPASDRPGGNLKLSTINMDDYRGPEGRAKLFKLKTDNPKLWEEIIRLKNK